MGVRMAVGMLVLSLILGIGCGGEPTQPQEERGVSLPGGVYTHAGLRFQICVPEGWYIHEQEVLPRGGWGSVEIYGPSLEGDFTPHLSVGLGKLWGPERTPKRAMDDLWRQLQRYCSNCVLESRRSLRIGGVEAEEMVYGTPSWDRKWIRVLLIREPHYFDITGGGPWGDFPIETYRGIVSSFRFIGGK